MNDAAAILLNRWGMVEAVAFSLKTYAGGMREQGTVFVVYDKSTPGLTGNLSFPNSSGRLAEPAFVAPFHPCIGCLQAKTSTQGVGAVSITSFLVFSKPYKRGA
eukprot:1139168-Pelagomonas_calceolata.AAC.5